MRNKAYPYNETKHPQSFREIVDEQARLYPERNAFVWTEKGVKQAVSRREFQKDIALAAKWLQENGLEKKHVALAGENSYAWILLFLAGVFLNNTMVPIDPNLPEDEIVSLLKRADVDAFFLDARTRRHLPEIGSHSFQVLDMQKSLQAFLNREPDGAFYESLHPDPNAVCLIYYTSGTTGLPKGVMLSQKNLLEDIAGSVELFAFDSSTVSVLPYHHSFGLSTSVLMAFFRGGEITICPSLRRVQKVVQEAGVQTLILVPVFIETFHKRIWQTAKKQKKDRQLRMAMKLAEALLKIGIDVRRPLMKSVQDVFGGHLEYIISGGAPLDQRYIDDFHAWGIQILQGYGITECSPVVGVNRNRFIKRHSAGMLLPSLEAKVSADGEILLKGPIVFSGYYKDPERTEEAFEEGWFKTGDLGRIDEDRFLFIQGRKKNLIILSSGENVSPEAIEEILQKDEGAEEVLVYGKDGRIAVSFYPAESLRRQDPKTVKKYFEELVQSYNKQQPSYRQIQDVQVRREPFAKNGAMKIKRGAINEQ